MGESIAGLLSARLPTPIGVGAMNNRFGQSGTPKELMKEYGTSQFRYYKSYTKGVLPQRSF